VADQLVISLIFNGVLNIVSGVNVQVRKHPYPDRSNQVFKIQDSSLKIQVSRFKSQDSSPKIQVPSIQASEVGRDVVLGAFDQVSEDSFAVK
jgi:hypothetical protein